MPNFHVRGESDVVTMSIRKCEFDVIWRQNEAPCLFDPEKNFCFQSAERKIQLMAIQEFGVCEDGLLFAAGGKSS